MKSHQLSLSEAEQNKTSRNWTDPFSLSFFPTQLKSSSFHFNPTIIIIRKKKKKNTLNRYHHHSSSSPTSSEFQGGFPSFSATVFGSMSKTTTIPFSFTINLLEIGFGVFLFIRFGIRGLLGWCRISLSFVKVCCFDFYAPFIWCQISVFHDFSLWAHWIVPKFVFLSRKFFFLLFTYCSYFFQLFQICFLLVSLEVQEFSRFELFQFHFCQS